ncbi:MAG: phycobilisome rod-core linker polypeptide CpcG [Oscillatoriales cyanobacterium RM2_1_1]|nr:phycobilisome rod-core linker polypeptide CpcG [Oscillatoriales cyanobacterium SM2_3_0]NJO47308.1 phycobilisome rod-core linker polypeptide CpcG [Oscillatoriales cyanobacterium RM2_1_1]
MTIPLLTYPPSSQNQRVAGYEVPGDEQPRIYNTATHPSPSEMDEVIWAAYRQIFNEQQMLSSNRQKFLESQLRSGQITVQQFIKGLATSEPFQRGNFEVNNNYRFVEMCVQRILGRQIYNEREKLAWSIVIATQGLQRFIDELVNSEEYLENFGEHTVPYQRRRILPQRTQGELPFARMPRYGEDHRRQLESLGHFQGRSFPQYRWDWQRPPYAAAYRRFADASFITITALATGLVVTTALGAWGIIPL